VSRTLSVGSALLLFLSLTCLALACSGAPETGPIDVVWDRDTCAHCYMTIGDRHAATQLRPHAGADAMLFDDLGCALLSLEDGALEDGALDDFAGELWVRSPEGDRWIDGRTARYTPGASTPMDYGVIATGDAAGMSLAEARARIQEFEDERRSARR
jgi:hypothetical protein